MFDGKAPDPDVSCRNKKGMKEKAAQDSTKSGYRSADSSGAPVASRLQILEYLSHRNQPATLQSICEHFDILSQKGVNALSGRLNRMSKNGYLLIDRKKRYGLPEKMDIVVGRVVGHAKGFGFVIPDQGARPRRWRPVSASQSNAKSIAWRSSVGENQTY